MKRARDTGDSKNMGVELSLHLEFDGLSGKIKSFFGGGGGIPAITSHGPKIMGSPGLWWALLLTSFSEPVEARPTILLGLQRFDSTKNRPKGFSVTAGAAVLGIRR